MSSEDPYLQRLGPHYDWYESILADLAMLERAAIRLRWSGWLWLFGAATCFILAMVLFGFGVVRAGIAFVIFSFMLFFPVMLYFGLARFVAVGRRWAVGLAILLVSAFTAAVVWRIVLSSRVHAVSAVVEVLYLVAALNLIKSLVQGWGAAKRIQRQRQKLKENAPMDQD